MTHRSAPLRRSSTVGALLLAAVGTGVLTAPGASAMTDPRDAPTTAPSAPVVEVGDAPASYLGSPDEPVQMWTGLLIVGIAEEQGNELGVPVALSGAPAEVPITPSDDDGSPGSVPEVYTCSTDETGACVFADEDGEYDLGLLAGDVITVEQLTPPSSGQFLLPPGDDHVVHAAVPASVQDVHPDRINRVAPSDEVDRMQPDVLSRRATFDQVVFFEPLRTDDGTTSDGATPDGPAVDVPAAGVPAPGGGASSSASSGDNAGAVTSQATATPIGGAGSQQATATSGDARSAPRGLATTGSDVLPVAATGALLLLSGAAALVAVRRRSVR